MAKTRSISSGVVSALEASGKDLAQPGFPFMRLRWAMLAFAIACLVIGFGLALSDLLTAWHTGQSYDWNEFWNSGFDLLRFSPFLLATRKSIWESIGGAAEHVRIARQAARSADDSAAPLAETQPEPLDTFDTSSNDTRELMLSRPHSTSRDLLGVCGWSLIVCGAIPLAIGIIMLSVSFFAPDGAGTWITAVILALSGIALAGSGWPLIWMRKTAAIVVVRADEMGVAWRSGSRRSRWRRISWDQALAFVTLSYRSMSTYQSRHLYALDTAAGVLCWEERDLPSWEAHADGNKAEHEDATYLCRLIVTRTGLSMRDISSALEPVKTVQPAKPALKLPLGPPGSLRHVPVDELVAEPMPPAPTRPPHVVRAERFVLSCLSVLTLLLYGGGWGLQQYQQRSIAQMPFRVHQERPLYSDALAFDDGDWLVGQPSAGNSYATRTYIDGTYHIKGIDHNGFLSSWTSLNYGNVAVEVTASQRRTEDGDGVGLVLRVNENQNDFLAFYVDSSGWFWLEHYHYTESDSDSNWSPVGGDRSSAIHTGTGASNRLLVILSGTQIRCFINGRFVGTYSDDDLWLNGRMGMYVNDSTTEGIFSNFAVYPVPPPQFPF